MSLDRIIGGTINRGGGIDGPSYRPTGFSVNQATGGVYRGYDRVASIDNQGIVRDTYGNDRGISMRNGVFDGYRGY
jgi:hypothetical protein